MRGKTGAARIAMAADAPLLPVAITGTPDLYKRFLWRRPEVVVRYGAPLCAQADVDDPEAARKFIDAAMSAMAALLPQEMHGVYAAGYQESQAPQTDVEEVTTEA